jgi:WD40 repeat protein
MASVGELSVQLWDGTEGTRIGPALQGAIQPLAFSPDGKVLVSASLNNHALLYWDTSVREKFDVQTERVSKVVLSPTGEVALCVASGRLQME